MKQEQKKMIKIIHEGNVLLEINAKSPNLENIVSKIIVDPEIDVEKLALETEIESFDNNTFLGILKKTIRDIKEDLKNEIDKYEEVVKSLNYDDEVVEYYKKMLEQQKK
ncbi:MAG: hypothetical protein GX931_04225 [Acholeplasmataceae bacterium]|jgi:hypothetical protein|nr:hypothetical protein [Acholeplasmataceae bacterium]